MKEDNPEMILMDSVELIAVIHCSRCNDKDNVNCFDMDEAMKSFYSDGWRSTPKNTYCPKCAKKYLKSKSKKR